VRPNACLLVQPARWSWVCAAAAVTLWMSLTSFGGCIFTAAAGMRRRAAAGGGATHPTEPQQQLPVMAAAAGWHRLSTVCGRVWQVGRRCVCGARLLPWYRAVTHDEREGGGLQSSSWVTRWRLHPAQQRSCVTVQVRRAAAAAPQNPSRSSR
jgi:hypothetical protein